LRLERTNAAVFLAVGVLVAASDAHADYLAHAVDEGSSPLPEFIEGIDARYLVELDWKYRGGRSPIAILPVTDAAGTNSADTAAPPGNDVPVAAIHEVVAEAMRQTGRFDVTAAASGAAPERAPSEGHRLQVSVTRYESSVAKQISNPRAVRSQRPQAERGRVALRIRLVGPDGELALADQVEAVVDEPRPNFESKLAVPGSHPAGLWRTSVGQATLAAINQGVYKIVKSVGPLPVTGRVVKAEENRLWVNIGAGALSVGDQLEVTTEGEQLVDPETGLNLGGLETPLATLRVVQVAERFSIAEILSALGTPSRGDRVRSTSAPQGFEFAPSWIPSG